VSETSSSSSAARLTNPLPREPATRPSSPERDTSANDFLTALLRSPLILDSAMGTGLVGMGLDLRFDDPALWNLTHPEHVLERHRRDVSAGADAISTNTFGANRFWLAKFGHAGSVDSINRRAVELARLAAGRGLFVLGNLGPSATRLAGAAVEQADILVDAGVDALYFETFSDLEIEPVLLEMAARSAKPVPLLVSLWDWPEPPDACARRLIDLGASAIGINCQAGMEAAVAFAQRLHGIVDCPLLVKPGSGERGRRDGSPAAFAAAVPTLLAHHVRLLGGCCGASERHIAALRAEIAKYEG
jgi:methionine synthase I (cobalamin-dependent)